MGRKLKIGGSLVQANLGKKVSPYLQNNIAKVKP
jgi:hypothetical protein